MRCAKQNLALATAAYKAKCKAVRDAKQAQWDSEQHFCKTCGKQFYKKIGTGIYCSRSCSSSRPHSLETKQKIAIACGSTNCSSSYHGYYKDLPFQSSYELIFLVYCLDHDIKIERCKFTFEYVWQNSPHVYIPDFYLPDTNTIVELKSERADKNLVEAKANSVPKDFSYKLLYGYDLEDM